MANIKDKRTFYPSDESADYLNQFKRGTLSDNLNNIIELLHENDADYLQLTKIIDFYNEFKPLVDMQVRGSFEPKAMSQHPMPMSYIQPQAVSIENNATEKVTNEKVVESDSKEENTLASRTKQLEAVKDYDDDCKSAILDMDLD